MKVLLTGGNGFLGKEIQRLLLKDGIDFHVFRSSEFDLRDENQVLQLFQQYQPSHVINAAARLGGIGDNQRSPVNYFRDNMLIGMNVVDACQRFRVNRLVQVGSVCSYPKLSPSPFQEKNVWNGYPEETNAAYGIAKRSLIALSEAYARQYDLNTVNILLANLYGPGDDFRDATSHVIPAIIKKIAHGIKHESPTIEVWGDGSPTRDFLFITDAAAGIVKALKSSTVRNVDPINLGTGKETSIREVVENLVELMGYRGGIYFDTSKPNGQPKRVLDISLAREDLDFEPKTELVEGLSTTIDFYLNNCIELDKLGGKYDKVTT